MLNLVGRMTLSEKLLYDLELIKTCLKALHKHLLKKFPSRSVKAISECTLHELKESLPQCTYKKREKSLNKCKGTLLKIGTKKDSFFRRKNSLFNLVIFNIILPAALCILCSVKLNMP